MSCAVGCDKHIHSMKRFIQWGRNRATLHNGHVVFGCFGVGGSGKSETCLQILSNLQGKPIDVATQVAYRPKHVKGLAQALPRFMAIQDDEAAGTGGHKRQPMTNENVDSVMDFDAMRGRNQYTGMCAIARGRLDSIKQDHLMWAFELQRDRTQVSLVGWERIRASPMFEGEPWFEERITMQPGEVRSLMDVKPWGPQLRAAYLAGKQNHMDGGTEDRVVTQMSREAEFEGVALKELRAWQSQAQ